MPSDERRRFLEKKYGRESVLQTQIMKDLARNGFTLRYHTSYSLGSKPGFLDITAINPSTGVLWTAELKGARPILHPGQQEWIDGWAAVNRIVCAGYVYPADYDAVALQLQRLGGRG